MEFNKICCKCFKQKPSTKFKLFNNKYISNECDDCKKEYQLIYQKEYRAKHKQQILERDRIRRELAKKNREPRITKSESNLCSKKGCYEHKIEFKGLLDYCKSHAFDKLYG